MRAAGLFLDWFLISDRGIVQTFSASNISNKTWSCQCQTPAPRISNRIFFTKEVTSTKGTN